MTDIKRFREFVQDFTRLVDSSGNDEDEIFAQGMPLLGKLVGTDDWLPDEFAQPGTDTYRQYLLYCDPLERFSVVSFVWGPGQSTPVHDHTVWGMIGMMRGVEHCSEYACERLGAPLEAGERHKILPGECDRVSPRIGDIHKVENALTDRPSISIHVYGGNIGAVSRHVFEPATGEMKPFVSGYSNVTVPNLWDRSAEVRAAITARA